MPIGSSRSDQSPPLKSTANSAVRIGAWRVDPSLDEISKDGNTVKLEPRAMQLLLCLAERPGQVVSVEQLLDRVWAGVVVTPDSVYHAVAALRRTLGDDSHEPSYIATVPRRGYRLVAPVNSCTDAVTGPADSSPSPPITPTGAFQARQATGFPRRWSGKLIAVAVVAVVVVVVGAASTYVAVDRFRVAKHGVVPERDAAAATPATPVTSAPVTVVNEKSIAVLPFTDMSEKRDQEYFGDGMAEEIISLLSQVPDLHVAARTSSFYFKGKSTKVPDIARELGTTYLLEGSVRRSASQLRVTAQLVRADTGYHVWSQTYDRDLRDVFKVQDDIANSVVQALQVTLLGGPLARRQGGTQNFEAYQLYLRARSEWAQNSRPTLAASRDNLDRAIKLDPKFGLAWAWLAATYVTAADDGFLPPQDGYEHGRRLAKRASELSPDMAEAHGVLSYVARCLDWNWALAQAEANRALAVGPKDPEALAISGLLALTLGHWDEAARRFRSALEGDPLNPYRHANVGMVQYGTGRFADAESSFRRALELGPDFAWGRLYLARALLVQGKVDAALAILQQERDDQLRLALLPIALQAAGRKAEADAALQELIARFGSGEAYWVAASYAQGGDHDQALHWLERAYDNRDLMLVEIVGEALFKNLADDPRYKAFLRKMNLPE